MGSISVDKFGCFGKLPVSREFLVERSAELTRSGFDSWVSEGVALARAPLGAVFKDRATRFPPYRFLWTMRSGGALVGELGPGQDAAGRIHPFSIFAVLDDGALHGARASEPARLAGLHATVADAIIGARSDEDPSRLTGKVREMRTLLPDEGAEETSYRDYVAAQSCGTFWSAVAGGPLDPVRYQILQGLCETVEYLRGRNASDVRMGIRFPLPERSAPLAVGVWIDLVARLFRASIDGCSYFWTDGDGIDFRPHLLFFFSTPTSAQFLALIDPSSDVESISYLERPYGGPPEARMNAGLRAILDDPAAPLRALLDWASLA